MELVTGATGFLGSYVARALVRKGKQVRAIKRSTSSFQLLGKDKDKIDWVEGDLLDVTSLENALQGIERVYHCAGIVPSGTKNRERAMAVNITGAANLYNMALQSRVKKAIHVSSTIALGFPVKGKLIDENHVSAPVKELQHYFESKRQGELEAWRAGAEGLDIIVVNPGGVIGAGTWSHEPLNIFSTVDKGLSFYTDGSNGFADVRDVADVMIQLMDSSISGERFILVAESLSLRELINMVADELAVRRPSYKLNKFLLQLAGYYESVASKIGGRAPRFSNQDLQLAQIEFNYNNEKVKQLTGFKFRPIKETIHETAQYFLDSKRKGLNYAIFE